MRKQTLPSRLPILATLAFSISTTLLTAQDTISFQRDVRLILSDKCYKCHGPDAEAREADLRLDDRDEAEHVLDPKQSDLVDRIFSDDADEQMPPPDSKLKLTEKEKQTLKQWVAQGAEYEKHWSFNSLNSIELPDIIVEGWARNEIDRFVSHKLLQKRLTPQKPASKEKLIRRLTFDLIGLPPTLEEIDQFLNDNSENAYIKLVDRLLSRTEYGERMAAEWMDVARYSDSYGYQVDRDRFVWPWRDWVIKSFNRNMSYDEFVTLQLAGDLLPDATDEQILATTFNRLHSQKVEGGSVEEEFRVEYVADRNHTFATAFLGLTMECCRCHDHKYDPLSQKEYYELFAFFNSIDEAGLYSYFTSSIPTPTLLLTDDQQKKQIADLKQAAELEEKKIAAIAASDFSRELNEWLSQLDPKSDSESLVPGRIAYVDFEKQGIGKNTRVAGKTGQAVKLTGDDAVNLKVGNFKRTEPFSVSFWMNTPDEKDRAVIFHRSRAWTDAASRGYQLLTEDGFLSFSLIHFWPGNAIRVKTKNQLPIKSWQHITVTYDGSSKASGIAIYQNGARVQLETVRDNLYKNITGGGGDNIAIGQRFRDRGFTNGLIDEFQVFHRRLSALEAQHLFDGQSLTKSIAEAKQNQNANQQLKQYFLLAFHQPYQTQLKTLQAARQKQTGYLDKLREIMVMRELPEARPTFLLKRGAYNARGEQVFPATPKTLSAFPADAPRNRLGLAQWLTAPDNPLLARVTVNRYWQMIFGTGLVATPEDFGSQGSPPTHPELLDWLAQDFIANGWDVKRLLKQMVMSATYRQKSTVSKQVRTIDPDNVFLGRGPVYRLSAEMIRDNALAVSGLLVKKTGGPSVKPYEVTVSFKPVAKDKGEGLYRRSLYTYWKRTAPAPVMITLNSSKRDVCMVKRERTSGPLQSFVLLNDPQFVEAAKMLAQSQLKKTKVEKLDAVIEELFRLLTSRKPNERESKILTKLYEEQLAYFEQEKAAAEKFLKTGDAAVDKSLPQARLAALTSVVSAIMNFDECVMKR